MIEEITFLGDPEISDRHLELFRRQEAAHFFACPTVEFAFLAFAVRIFRGIEAAPGMRHIAQHIADNSARHIGKLGLSAHEVRIKVEVQELRVVVEHFFDMGHEPLRVHRVA